MNPTNETFGARFLETVTPTEYGCGCEDVLDPGIYDPVSGRRWFSIWEEIL